MNRQLLASAVAALAVASFAASVAHAESRRVVVEQFTGPSADKVRRAVVSALGDQSGIEVIAEKKVAQVEADLGLISVSDAYAAVAKELKAVAFVAGAVSGGKKPKAKVTVRGPDGSPLGDESWSANDAKKLAAIVESEAGDKLATFIGKSGGGGGGGKTGRIAKNDEPASDVAGDQDDARASEDEASKKGKAKPKPKGKAKTKDADDEISASAEAEGGATIGVLKGLDLAFGVHYFFRTFKYNQNLAGGQKDYDTKIGAPGVGLAADYFFGPLLGLHAVDVGVTADFELVPPKVLVSEGAINATDKGVFATNYNSWHIGAKVRYPVAPVDLIGNVAFGSTSFGFTPFTDSTGTTYTASALSVSYTHVRAGLDARARIGPVALLAGAHYMHILKAGEITGEGAFKYATLRGTDGFLGVALPLPMVMPGLEARLILDYKLVVFDMHSENRPGKPDPRIAGGATDFYKGVTVQIAYRGQ